MVHVVSHGPKGAPPKPFTVEARYGVSRRVIGALPAQLDDVAATSEAHWHNGSVDSMSVCAFST